MHTIRSKVEPATVRIKILLEVLSSYFLSDFLLRQRVDNSNPCAIIPILFNVRDVLQESTITSIT